MHPPTYTYLTCLCATAGCVVVFVRPMHWHGAIVVAPILWTLQEYVAHRCLLYNTALTWLHATHRSHHKRQEDVRRLLIPMEITVAFALANGCVCAILTDVAYALWFMLGNTLCYVVFEYVHVCAHLESSPWMASVTSHHRRHHIRTDVNFGFTSATWDVVFGTYDGDTSLQALWCVMIPYPVIPLALRGRLGLALTPILASLPWLTSETDLVFYRDTHTHPVNRIVHMWCVPVLVWTAFALVSKLRGGWFASIATAISFGVHAKTISFTLVLVLLAWTSTRFSVRLALSLHVASWIVQVVVGHGMFEGSAPALVHGFRASLCVAPQAVYHDIVDSFRELV